ncbi:MAG: hypothetical protein ALECFALPRED_007621 [Alectoria fallacina]|uniref:RecA family profile 1 domain-containing protein n=1 Tax=Alectoria fallacina TaxID=1903189 RepID=A0A8H3G7M4_9LECA|nr:MAG: hypothetical protein ALECFALPRED_007621 [Alectoria fallacina]
MSDFSQAAPPLLGSSLLASAKAHEKARPLPASLGSATIDQNALDGGFRYGEITSIAGASGMGKTLLAYHAIASHLLTHKFGEVAFIDTTGSFSPLRLRKVLTYRLESQIQRNSYQETGYMYEKRISTLENRKEAMIEKATSMLDRVKFMRVFDFAGVVEAISEINELMEDVMRKPQKPTFVAVEKRRDEINDSEEELDEEDEELQTEGVGDPGDIQDSDRQRGSIGMIIIDTITNIVSAMMAKSQIQGQALLANFMRSLHHLTFRHHICTILTNAAVGMNPSNNPEYQHGPREDVSIFSSTLGRPALGKTFTFLIDTSIFLSAVPKTSDDATIAFGDGKEASSYQKALILEILKDRCGTREGRWAAFEIAPDVKIVPSG